MHRNNDHIKIVIPNSIGALVKNEYGEIFLKTKGKRNHVCLHAGSSLMYVGGRYNKIGDFKPVTGTLTISNE